jgi:hypothetical protein
MIGVDASVLTLILNEEADAPPDPTTGKPIDRVRDRVDFWIQDLHKNKQKIVIPTPALSEVLVRSGPGGLQYIDILQKAAVFDIRDFDKLAAVELALMTQQAIKGGGKKSGSKEPWQKIKLDRQIVAICKVASVDTLYAMDPSLANFARTSGMDVKGVHELSLPPESPQLTMDKWLEAAAQEDAPDEPKPEDIESDEPEKEPEPPPGPS